MLTVLLLASQCVAAQASTGAARPALQESLKDFDVDARWIYDDLDRGRQEARRTGRPLLVTFRCVPCDACRTIDFKVRKGDAALSRLLDRFVCVRIVHMKGVNLDLFQFDFDLSWAAVMLHSDGTVYSRYGSRGPGDSELLNTQAGFADVLRRTLELHAAYPANRLSLAGKQPIPGRYGVRYPEQHTTLKDRAAGPVVPKTCIHCHMIHDAVHADAYRAGTFDRESMWKYPSPDRIGVRLVPGDESLTARDLTPDSPAARSGLIAGDTITTLDGQPLLSRADLQWVLHHLGREATIAVSFRRGLAVHDAHLTLTGDWRHDDFSWRESMYHLKPNEHFWAPEMTADERRPLGLNASDLALKVKWIPDDSTAHAANLKEGDVIVAVDGRTNSMTPRHLSMWVRINKLPGDPLALTVLRNGKRLDLIQRLE